jgi:hypothetical protein
METAFMTFATPEMVISGKPHLVVLVEDRSPQSLDDFAGAEHFTVELDAWSYRVNGSGRLVDDEVRFHEKDVENNGKDIRVWRVIRHDDGTFLANHAASF